MAELREQASSRREPFASSSAHAMIATGARGVEALETDPVVYDYELDAFIEESDWNRDGKIGRVEVDDVGDPAVAHDHQRVREAVRIALG